MVALDDDLRLHPQPHIAVATVVVEPRRRCDVLTVRQLLDLGAQTLLRVVHPVVRSGHAGVGTVLLEQTVKTIATEDTGGLHGLHVAAVHRLGADVVEDHAIQVLVQHATLVPLETVVDLRLGVHVERIRVDTRIRTTDVGDVSGDGSKAEQLALPQDRHSHRDIWRMRRTQIGVVVDDDVAFLQLVLINAMQEAADVPRQRTNVHRRRLGLAKLATLSVEQARAEILGFADDRRVRHAEQHARHLLCNCIERTTEHAERDRIDPHPLAGGLTGVDAYFGQISH